MEMAVTTQESMATLSWFALKQASIALANFLSGTVNEINGGSNTSIRNFCLLESFRSHRIASWQSLSHFSSSLSFRTLASSRLWSLIMSVQSAKWNWKTSENIREG